MAEKVERDRMIFSGTVTDSNKGKFTILTNEGMKISATLSGKIRTNSVKILVGDIVDVEVSPYSTDQGRIIFRHKS